MMTPTTTLPLPVVPPEVEAFAAEKGVGEYLPRVLEFVRRLFPHAPLVVELYEDPEIHELKTIRIEVQVPFDTDFAKDIAPGYDGWSREHGCAGWRRAFGRGLPGRGGTAVNNGPRTSASPCSHSSQRTIASASARENLAISAWRRAGSLGTCSERPSG